jgi:formylglycine-generating enzyme required for sulfatase activity/serine/threonine protein kinase
MPATPKPDPTPRLDSPAPPTRSDADLAHPTAAPQPSGNDFVLAVGQRPLPDYELICKLGAGGFGEVWKAKGPGGFHVALKFVRLEQAAGETELRALELMKDVRHAHLLGLFGAWQQGGLLIIAMELADGTLRDRLRQAQAEDQPGIPRDELLEYLREAAKGLDFLNDRRLPGGAGGPAGIQHKDVKPQNLLLAGGTVKVADFGLAKVMEHTVTSASRGMTPAYAPPEFFNAQATRWSDQYSLAVSYCELRGGRLPFEGNQFQIMAGHVMQPPDLSMLPEAERPAVARALAKKPEERWPSCRAFAEALAEAGKPAPVQPPPPVPDRNIRRREGEALLARRYREALERTEGRPTPTDRDALAALCRGHGIPTERANTLVREVCARWHKERPAPRPAPVPPGRAGRRLRWLLAGALPLGGAAVLGLVLLLALSRGPKDDRRETHLASTGPGGASAVVAVVGDTGRETHPGTMSQDSTEVTRPQGPKPAADPQKGAPFTNSVGMRFVWIAPGSFTMGDPANEPYPPDDETPHRVTLTRGFHMGACLVTQAQWESVLGEHANRSNFKGKDDDEKAKLPVDNVSWFDCVEFCIKLSEQEGRSPRYRLTNVTRGADGAISAADVEVQANSLVAQRPAERPPRANSATDVEVQADGTGYRLPAEAQWEYACRAGTQTPFWWGSTITTDQANYDGTITYGKDGKKGENRQKTTPVDFFPANPWGLHDMGGNLWQWCEDLYAAYPAADATDPLNTVKELKNVRVLGGGSWIRGPVDCRAAYRARTEPAHRSGVYGCRVVLCLD